ncbi:MAG: permease-like cell division protein FtsX [Lachnospirales bacterium]
MNIRSISYYFKQMIKDLYMHRFMAFASIVTIFSCVLILVVSYALSANINHFMTEMEKEVNFAVFLNNDVEPQEASNIYEELNQDERIAVVTYVSSEEALESMKEDYGDGAEFLDGLEEDNPLPRSFMITLKDGNDSKDFLAYLTGHTGEGQLFSSVRHAQLETDILISIKNLINVISFVLLGILSFIDIVLIMNTIKMGIELRREEISIMKYIGATSNFIRMPFILEGALFGVIGGSIPPLILLLSYNKIISTIIEKAPIIQDLVTFKTAGEIFSEVFFMSIFFGVALGVIASILSVRKYLKV